MREKSPRTWGQQRVAALAWLLSVCALLAACGGGSDESSAEVIAHERAAAASAAVQAPILPPLWRVGGSAPQAYEFSLSPSAAFEGNYGASIRLTGIAESKRDFGVLAQAAKAERWRGQRVAMRAWIKTENAESAQMWLRIDGVDHLIAMDNMDHRAIVGTTGWGLYEIVMDVPQEAATLVYGVFLVGGGRVDFDNVQFLQAPVGAKTTTLYKESQLKLKKGATYGLTGVLEAPSNLDFEQAPGT